MADRQKLLNVVNLLQTPVNEHAVVEPPAFAQSLFVTVDDQSQEIKDRYFEAIQFASRVPKHKTMESFNPLHQEIAANFIDVFYEMASDDLECAAKYARSKVNASIVNYALTAALYHREDAVKAKIQPPSNIAVEPGMYFDLHEIKHKLKKDEKNVFLKEDKHYVPMSNNFTATNKEPENRVSYFREDIGINLHHRHWHEVYPFRSKFVKNQDRRGELFYYMHEQMLARYNFERMCNNLPPVEAFDNFRETVKEAYFPKLNSVVKASLFASRPVDTVWKNLRRDADGLNYTIADIEGWRDRIFDAIDRGYAYIIDPNTNEEKLKKIDETTGIDELINTVEAVPSLSWNFKYYGDMHNIGHLFFSYTHDPDRRFKEVPGVMGHTQTAVRDPVFYRWHTFIDDVAQRLKKTLPAYTAEQKQFKGITIVDVKIVQSEEDEPEYGNGEPHEQPGCHEDCSEPHEHRPCPEDCRRRHKHRGCREDCPEPHEHRWWYEHYGWGKRRGCREGCPENHEHRRWHDHHEWYGRPNRWHYGNHGHSEHAEQQCEEQQCEERQDQNVLTTFLEYDAVDITQALYDPGSKTPTHAYAVFTHLQHYPFKYEITVTNNLPTMVTGTFRIFMAPHFNESGEEMVFDEQRKMFIELDKFTKKLNPGENPIKITRESKESSVTIPFERLFTNVEEAGKKGEIATDAYCGCGWPQYMLIGKGTSGEGLLCDLFVMITDYDKDKVDASPLDQECCASQSSLSYCGARNKKYPDKRPMGFPFDRYADDKHPTVKDFMNEQHAKIQDDRQIEPAIPFSNMKMVKIRVRHEEGKARRGQTIPPDVKI